MKKLTYEFVKKSFEKEDYKLLSKEYKGAHYKLKYICSNNHKHSIRWSDWHQGKRCTYCAGQGRPTIEFIKSEFAKEDYKILVDVVYKNARTKLSYECSNGHKHSIRWDDWQHGYRCPYCAGLVKKTIEFIKPEFAKEGYILLTTEYMNCKQKLDYICPEGHRHNISWSDWKSGNRCPTCKRIKISGPNHWNWKNGVTSLHSQIWNFIQHIGWSKKILGRDDYICQRCKKKGGKLNAHHMASISKIIKYFNITTIEEAKNCPLLFDINNGVTLCESCHNWVHSKKNIDKEFLKDLEKAGGNINEALEHEDIVNLNVK